ncbi:MAG: hypothetical protein HY832_01570 [Candidatus Aenigmarchaeota archaeon]|nr:hypothetical protein [Candidatus Aenigmarchaeota archaeon]
MKEKTDIGNDYKKRTDCALARLHFAGDLRGYDWLSGLNRDSIGRMVHYGDQSCISQSPLTLGGFIDADTRYVADACARVFAHGGAITREEFIASFLELLLTEDQQRMPELSRDIAQLDPASSETFTEMIRDYLCARQIPAEDLYTAFGVYILQKARDQGVVSITDKVAYNGDNQQLRAKLELW